MDVMIVEFVINYKEEQM